ncbi:MAG: alpha-D-ribose 1-methylphosphonate 5-triphosphate diphosphatase [Alphaproteobacteria bacterium]
MTETILTNARVVLADEEIAVGTVVVRDGAIAGVDSGRSDAPGAIDLDGDVLLPGLVEVHTDNMEKHIAPRPKVVWPTLPAVIAHDADMASAGITTVLDALRIGDYGDGQGRADLVRATLDGIAMAREASLLRADHRLHLRCELCTPDAADVFEQFADEPNLALVSVMDHTPGQRQFRDMAQWRIYHGGRYNLNDDQLDKHIATKLEMRAQHSASNQRRVIETAKARGTMLASHDDTTVTDVEDAAGAGITIAEFPTTREAASAAHAHGMVTVAGAPNVVRGGSHSGNIAAAELAGAGLLDALSSDYVPVSLLHAAFMLADLIEALSLPAAIRTVATAPARMLGLDDRGEIAPGQRADLVRARLAGNVPVVRQVWCEGVQVV